MPYLKLNDIIRDLSSERFKVFSSSDFAKHIRVTKSKAIQFLSRNTKKRHFTRLKKDTYYITDRPPTAFDIANTIYRPSYISLETALSYYEIIPETIYTITSITTKHPKSFIIGNQEYKYHKVQRELYFGYKTIQFNSSSVLIAEKEKAFLDYLYFVAHGKRILNSRINVRNIKRTKVTNLFENFKGVVGNKSITKKMENIINDMLYHD